MLYLHIHFVWDRLFAWFAMVVAFPGRCVPNKRILLRSAAPQGKGGAFDAHPHSGWFFVGARSAATGS